MAERSQARREYDKRYKLAHPEMQRLWFLRHPDYRRDWNLKNPDYYHNYYLAHKERKLAQTKEWAAKNRDRMPGYMQTHRDKVGREAFALKQRNRELERNYGITGEVFANLKAIQDSRCAICKTPTDKLCVDHRHDQYGYVRGLLCRGCNTGIGALKDDAAILYAAFLYLSGDIAGHC